MHRSLTYPFNSRIEKNKNIKHENKVLHAQIRANMGENICVRISFSLEHISVAMPFVIMGCNW